MNLFFFYSGFFVPKSFDKKGRYDFLFDRVKRLGIPFVVYSFLIGPYIEGGFASLFFGLEYPGSPGNCGPTWFLNQLILFSIVYAFTCGHGWSPKIKCPSLLGFLLICAAIGLITGVLLLFFPSSDFFFTTPQFWQDYPSYPLYFFGGAIAQRNGWMEEIKEKKSRAVIYGLMLLNMAIVYPFMFLVQAKMPAAVGALLQGILWKGMMSVTVLLAVSVFFMDHVNKSYFCTKFFSKAMYTACKYSRKCSAFEARFLLNNYNTDPSTILCSPDIIQYAFPIQVGLKVMLSIFEATGNIVYTDPSSPSIYTMKIANDNLLFPAWLLVSAISLAIDWPLAYAIQAIPGFSEVL